MAVEYGLDSDSKRKECTKETGVVQGGYEEYKSEKG